MPFLSRHIPFLMRKKKQFLILLTCSKNGHYNFEQRRRVRKGKRWIKFTKVKSIDFDPEARGFGRGLREYFFWDVDNNKALSFHEVVSGFNQDINALHRQGGTLREIINSLEKRKDFGIIATVGIVGVIIGLLAGYLLGNFFPIGAFI